MIHTMDMKSDALQSNTVIKAVLPDDGLCDKMMILLHGNLNMEERIQSLDMMPCELELEALCQMYHMMIVIPLMKNCYYISTDTYDCDRFVSEELPSYIRREYDIPASVELVLGGVSMGGFGAALIGARTGRFKKIISISGSFIVHDIEIGNPEVWGDLTPCSPRLRKSFLYYFLPLSDVNESMERNPIASLQLFSKRSEKPCFAITCGTEDWLYSRNLDFIKALEENGINYKFFAKNGGLHESSCFKSGLWQAVEWVYKQPEGNYCTRCNY